MWGPASVKSRVWAAAPEWWHVPISPARPAPGSRPGLLVEAPLWTVVVGVTLDLPYKPPDVAT